MKKFMKKYWEYVAAFLIPIFLVLVHCITRNVWLFGDGSILRGDAGVQYIYIFEELWNKVHSGDFSFFSWNATCGYDFYLNMLYYTVSPTTLLVLLFPKSWLENVVQFIMVFKLALLSFTTVYFFMHTKYNLLKKNRRLVSLVLGLCYVLSNFIIGMFSLFNWMDTLILFPVLLLLVEKMIENGKWKLYYVLLTVAMMCNCYIAFPICLFLFLWFLLNLMNTTVNKKKVVFTFLGSSVGAACSSMAFICPLVLNVSMRYSSVNGTEAQTLYNYIRGISILPNKLIERFFAFSPLTIGADLDFTFYMSMGAIVLVLLFLFIKMNKREKYMKLGIFILLLCSIFFGSLNYIWHAFSLPHCYSPRFGFIFIMMLLIMALDVLSAINQLKLWHGLVTMVIGIGLFCYSFFNIKHFEEPVTYLVTILLFVFYIILLVLLVRKSITVSAFIRVFLLTCLLELSGNAYYQFKGYNIIKPEDSSCNKETLILAEEIPLMAGQRVVYTHATDNIGMKTEQPSVSGFISYFDGKLGDTSYQLGVGLIPDAGFFYVGGSPFMDVFYNVAYGIGKCETEFNDCKLLKEGDELNLYKNEQLTGLGYMVDASVTEWMKQKGSPFELQNEFIRFAAGQDGETMFRPFLPENLRCATTLNEIDQVEGLSEPDIFGYQYETVFAKDGNVLSFEVQKDMDLYFTAKISTAIGIVVKVDDVETYRSEEKNNQIIIPIGKVKRGQTVNVVCIVEQEVGTTIRIAGQFAEWNGDAWNSAYQKLSKEVYQIDEMKSDYVTGEISAEKDGIMMTSIPAMDGFKVYVDGEQTEYEEIGGAFIGVPLKAGKHQIEFKYRTPYAVLGWLISVFSIGTFVTICIRGKKKHVSVFCEEK